MYQLGTTLKVELTSKKIFKYTPILATSFRNTSSPTKSPAKSKGYLKSLREGKITGLLSRKYIHTKFIFKNGVMEAEVKCLQMGPQFYRIVWMDQNQIQDSEDPVFFQVINETTTKLSNFTIQTILPNLVKDWESLDYDAYHICPIQKTSHSLYAIVDQLKVEHNVQMKQKLVFMDIVLNHTAIESEWLNDEECVYNENTVPHLRSALDLDMELVKKVQKYDDIAKVIQDFRMEEYFQIQQDDVFVEDSDEDNIFKTPPEQQIANYILDNLKDEGIGRFQTKVDLELVNEFLASNKLSKNKLSQAIHIVNHRQLEKSKKFEMEAIWNTQQQYKNSQEIKPYFIKLKNWYAILNGYIDNQIPHEDIATSKNFYYLRRQVNIWRVVKLNYGDNKHDYPYLIQRMTEYIEQMSHYNGLRLDNIHNTQFWVLKYFMKRAREFNNNIILIAEYFHATDQQELKLRQQIGVNLIIKELNYYCPIAIASRLIFSQKDCIFYDQSHDNQSVVQQHGPQHLLCLVSVLSFSDKTKGTTKLVDEFYDRKINVAYETLKYPTLKPEIRKLDKKLVCLKYMSDNIYQTAILKGSFDNWQNNYYLKYKDGYYEHQFELIVGEYDYKFILDGQWKCDETQPIRNENNYIIIKEIQVTNSLQFIRKINRNLPLIYIQYDQDYIIITRSSLDYQDNQVMIILFNQKQIELELIGNIEQIEYQYSYLYQTNKLLSQQNEFQIYEHLINLTTNYCKYNKNIINIDAPKATVIVLKCQGNESIQNLRNYEMSQEKLYQILQNQDKIQQLDQQFYEYSIQVPKFIRQTILQTNLQRMINIDVKDRFEHILNIQLEYFRKQDFKQYKIRWILISFKPLYLLNNNFQQARDILVYYSKYFQQGLLPTTFNPLRYSNRDNSLWWIRALRNFVEITNDYTIIDELKDKIQEIFQNYAQGVKYKDKNINIYAEKDASLIQLQLDEETGFIIGGSYKNALTWMDYIGQSDINVGIPSASRDGAPIECTALLKLSVDFLYKLYQLGKYSSDGIKYLNRTITWKAWSDFIQSHFEQSYWVDTRKMSTDDKYARRRGIYKDLYKSSKQRSDFQLRPNAILAICVAPELFQKQKATLNLAITETQLISQNSLGVSTLDSIASEYDGCYHNEETQKINTSKGFSLYNGCEFVFLLGFYLKSLIKIHGKEIQPEIFYAYLKPIRDHMLSSYTIPEFTNHNGQLCQHSDSNSIVSVALIKEAIYDYLNISK